MENNYFETIQEALAELEKYRNRCRTSQLRLRISDVLYEMRREYNIEKDSYKTNKPINK